MCCLFKEKMSIKERWLASFGTDKEIYTLSERGSIGEYLTRDKPSNDYMDGRTPVFHVWDDDNWLYCGTSQQRADEIFAKACKQKEFD